MRKRNMMEIKYKQIDRMLFFDCCNLLLRKFSHEQFLGYSSVTNILIGHNRKLLVHTIHRTNLILRFGRNFHCLLFRKAHSFTYIFTILWTIQHTQTWHGYSFKLQCGSIVWHLMHLLRDEVIGANITRWFDFGFLLKLNEHLIYAFGFNVLSSMIVCPVSKPTRTSMHLCSLISNHTKNSSVVNSFLMKLPFWDGNKWPSINGMNL